MTERPCPTSGSGETPDADVMAGQPWQNRDRRQSPVAA